MAEKRDFVLKEKNEIEDGLNPKSEAARVNKGIELGVSGNYYEAIECFDKVLEINPKNEEAWYHKGTAGVTI